MSSKLGLLAGDKWGVVRLLGNAANEFQREWKSTKGISLQQWAWQWKRDAHHKSEGCANGPKDGPGKRLGAKKGDGEKVVPGNIIFRQRGTHWHPGENCYMGRDHSIHAGIAGYVRYYQDELKHKGRKYIGVVYDRSEFLPRAVGEPRSRRVRLTLVKRTDSAHSNLTDKINSEIGADNQGQIRPPIKERLPRRRDYINREPNWKIGKIGHSNEKTNSSKFRNKGGLNLGNKRITLKEAMTKNSSTRPRKLKY